MQVREDVLEVELRDAVGEKETVQDRERLRCS